MIIFNGKIFLGDGQTLEQGWLRVENGRIAEIGEGAAPKVAGEEMLDAAGMLVTPGFVDSHTNLGMWEDSLGFEGDDGNEDTDPCTPQLRAIDAVNPMERCFSEALAAGVTTVLTGPGSSNPIGGQFSALKTSGRAIDRMVVKELAGVKFALGENPKTSFHSRSQTPVTRMATAALIREQLSKAQRYRDDCKAAEEDDELDMPEYDAKCEALLPLLAGECKAFFHAHRADDVFTALRISREFGLDAVMVHATEGHLVAEELAQAKAKVIWGPMMCSRTKPELSNYTPAAPGLLSKQGIPVALCTDHPELPIQYLALSAALASAEGMDRTSALNAITSVPAEICGIADRVGKIAVGMDADLLLFDRDTFAVGTKPVVVFVNGKKCIDIR